MNAWTEQNRERFTDKRISGYQWGQGRGKGQNRGRGLRATNCYI